METAGVAQKDRYQWTGAVADMRHPDNIAASSKYLDGNSKIIQTETQDGQRDIVNQNFYDEPGRSEKTTLPIANDMGINKHLFIPGITGDFSSRDYLAYYYNLRVGSFQVPVKAL